MTDDKRSNEKALLAAALLAQTGAPRGAAPTDEELVQWVAHTLDEPRRSEVDSHIAHSPGAFDRAMALIEQPTANQQTTGGWRAPLALAATAVIAVAGLATLLRTPPSTTVTTAEPSKRVVRSGADPTLDWRSAAFQGGFVGTPQDDALAADRLRIDQCLDGDDCTELARVLYRYGALLAGLEQACTTGAAPAPAARAELDQIERAIAGSLELAPWLAPARRLRQSMDSGPDTVCAEVTQLKARYLP
jgi:hypothetical protein